MPSVFVSYSHKDEEFLQSELLPVLKSNGINPWYAPDDIRAADEWERKILHGLESSEWFVVVMSPNASESDWVKAETHWAVERRKGQVIPLMLESCNPADLHLKLLRIQFVDFRQQRELAAKKLIWVLQACGVVEELTFPVPVPIGEFRSPVRFPFPVPEVEDGTKVRSESQSGGVNIAAFSIDLTRCEYIEYNFDPDKPYWPEEDDGAYGPITGYIGRDGRTYASENEANRQGGGCTEERRYTGLYGKIFTSRQEAEEYGAYLQATRNHRSFSGDSVHTKFFDRQNASLDPDSPNYPCFYVSISNTLSTHVVFTHVDVEVLAIEPLLAIGQSHSLEPLGEYTIHVAPAEGITRIAAVPNIKIEAGDAAAIRLTLVPRVGGYSWLLKIRTVYSPKLTAETEPFLIIM